MNVGCNLSAAIKEGRKKKFHQLHVDNL